MPNLDSEAHLDAAAAEAEPRPRIGVRIAVVKGTFGVEDIREGRWFRPLALRGLPPTRVVTHTVYIQEGEWVSPVFTAVRNPWEITDGDDLTKQTAIEMVRNVDLALVPPKAGKAIEVFRAECAAKVNYGSRSFNVDAARIDDERVDKFQYEEDVGHYLLTPNYHAGGRKH